MQSLKGDISILLSSLAASSRRVGGNAMGSSAVWLEREKHMGSSDSQHFVARFRFLKHCLTAILATVIPVLARGETLNLDFASGLDQNNFTFTSSRSQMVLDDTGGNLRLLTTSPMSVPGSTVDSVGVNSDFFLHGDFLIKIGYTLNTPIVTGEQVSLGAINMAVVRSLEVGNNNYHVWDGSGWRGTTSATDTFGQFQIARTGNQLTSTIYRGSSTTPEILYTMTVTTSDVPFGIGVNANAFAGWSGSQSFDVSFDNLQITADALVGYIVPEPSALMLASLGMAGLMGRRTRRRG